MRELTTRELGQVGYINVTVVIRGVGDGGLRGGRVTDG